MILNGSFESVLTLSERLTAKNMHRLNTLTERLTGKSVHLMDTVCCQECRHDCRALAESQQGVRSGTKL